MPSLKRSTDSDECQKAKLWLRIPDGKPGGLFWVSRLKDAEWPGWRLTSTDGKFVDVSVKRGKIVWCSCLEFRFMSGCRHAFHCSDAGLLEAWLQ